MSASTHRVSLPLVILAIHLLVVLSHAKIEDIFLDSSNLPIVIIDTHGQIIVDKTRIVAHMGIIDNGPDQRNNLNDPYNDYDGFISIEIRGSTAQMFPKKQYALETQDEYGENLNVSLMGMPPENDWILYAPYSDKSLIRNALTYNIVRSTGRYASRTRLCELLINDDYRGVYVLMEKIKRDKNRVRITRMNPQHIEGDEVTGGYILKIDKPAGETFGGWNSPYRPFPGAWQQVFYQYHYPKPDRIVPEQETYIRDFISSFEDIMASENYADPQQGYSQMVDMSSFVDYVIVNELTKNIDGYRLSAFMYKDRDSNGGQLTMGPVWDYNLAFGNADYHEGWSTDGWQIEFEQPDDFWQIPFWWSKIWKDTTFTHLLNDQWHNLRQDLLSETQLLSVIDSMTTQLSEAQKRNFKRWPVLGSYVWPNVFIGQTYEGEIEYLKGWLVARLKWVDKHLPGQSMNIQDQEQFLANSLYLHHNYPNPFNAITTIAYKLPKSTFVNLSIYNAPGQLVETLVDEHKEAGSYKVEWNARRVGSGIYFYRIEAGEQSETKKCLILK